MRRSKNTKQKNLPRNRTGDDQHLVDQNSSSEEWDGVGYTFSVYCKVYLSSTGKEQLQPMFNVRKIIEHYLSPRASTKKSENPSLQVKRISHSVMEVYCRFKVQVNMH